MPNARPSWRRAAVATAALLAAGLTGAQPTQQSAQQAPAQVGAPTARQALPSFAELEAAGARFGTIRFITRDIFDTSDPRENNALYRAANALHIQTRPGVIERSLLFKTGDPVSVRQIEESERVLRTARYLYDVSFTPVAVHDGVVDVDVETRDTWSIDFGASAGRAGGTNSSGLRLKDYNLLGTGIALGFGRSKNVDRSGTEFELSNEHAFGTWTALHLSSARNSDGHRDATSVVRPFYALDARWAAGLTAVDDQRVESIYRAGDVASQYRHKQTTAEAFGGWSAGLVDGWVQRYSAGLSLRDDRFGNAPDLVAPPALPVDDKQVAPFVRYELLEDRFEKLQNRNLIGRPEFFSLGLSAKLQLGWAATGLGSSQNTLQYAASVSRGFVPGPEHTLIAASALSGEYTQGQVRRLRLGAQVQYYRPQGPHWLFFASTAADVVRHTDPADELLLGGDNGLRGYPLRYQSGQQRALFTVEERFFTDIYLWRLFRIGGAAFFDAGRAWGGANPNTDNPGWLRNAGFGLRIVSARAAFSNVLHVDVAFPLDRTPGIKGVQFLVKTKASF